MAKHVLKSLVVAAVGSLLIILLVFQKKENWGNPRLAPSPQDSHAQLGKQDAMDKAVEMEYLLTRDTRMNQVPRERLLKANEMRAEKLRAYALGPKKLGAVPDMIWSNFGPRNIGGRTRSILFDLNDSANGYKKVWAASVSGGLWSNPDVFGSGIWSLQNDFFSNLAITSIAQDPSDPRVLYFGTGEGWFNLDAVRGLGIWKSDDKGATWSQLASTAPPANRDFSYVQKIVVNNQGHVYAACRSSEDPADEDIDFGGIMRSKDKGATWERVIGAPGASYRDMWGADVEVASNGDLYATTGFVFNANQFKGRVWKSEKAIHGNNTGDAGNWIEITPPGSWKRIELGISPENPNFLYAMCQAGNGNHVGGIFSSNDGGASWTARALPSWCDRGTNTNDFTRGQAWYDMIIGVRPGSPSQAFFGGVDLMRTANAGANFSQASTWLASSCGGALPYVHADMHAIAYRPGSSDEFVVGCDGGVFVTTNNGASFTEKTTNYITTQYYAGAVHPGWNENIWVGGTQDNGTQRMVASNNATVILGGDGAYAHIDQDEPTRWIGAFPFQSYAFSTTGGNSFNFVNIPSRQQSLFINPTDFDDKNNILYGGFDAGKFLRIKEPHTLIDADSIIVPAFGGSVVTHVHVSEITPNRVYVGLLNGRIVRVDNAHDNATLQATIIGTQNNQAVSSIAVDPCDENHLLVTFSNYGAQSVWETKNGGANWLNVEGNLPDMPVRWAMFDPRNSNWAIIATELGVWSSDNINGAATDWTPTNNGLANVRVSMLQYRPVDGRLVAFTHGRGIFASYIITPAELSFAASVSEVSENGVNGSVAGCASENYKEYSFFMQASSAVTNDIILSVNSDSGTTARRGIDYDLTDESGQVVQQLNLLIVEGSHTSNSEGRIRIYNDDAIEEVKKVVLRYSVVSGSGVQMRRCLPNSLVFSIIDDDALPTRLAKDSTWYASGAANRLGWLFGPRIPNNNDDSSVTITAGRSDVKIRGAYLKAKGLKPGYIQGLKFFVNDKLSTKPYRNFFIQYVTPFFTSNVFFASQFNTVAGENVIRFSVPLFWNGTSDFTIRMCFDNDGANMVLQDIIRAFQYSQEPLQSYRVSNLPGSVCNQAPNPQQYVNIPSYEFLQEFPPDAIHADFNYFQTRLGPNEEIYLKSPADNSMQYLAKIKNNSNFDFGCISAYLLRNGTGGKPFFNFDSSHHLADKVFEIIPENHNPNADYRVTLYFTAAEVAGWEAVTLRDFNEVKLVKSNYTLSDISPPISNIVYEDIKIETPVVENFLNGKSVSANFTGFSSFAVGVPGDTSNNRNCARCAGGSLPVNWLYFSGHVSNQYAQLQWRVSPDLSNKGFVIEKSSNSINWKDVSFVAARPGANDHYFYRWNDPELLTAKTYYRIRQIDHDGSASFSKVIVLKSTDRLPIAIASNPFKESILLQGFTMDEYDLQLFDVSGNLLAIQRKIPVQSGQIVAWKPSAMLRSGQLYLLRIKGRESSFVFRVMKE